VTHLAGESCAGRRFRVNSPRDRDLGPCGHVEQTSRMSNEHYTNMARLAEAMAATAATLACERFGRAAVGHKADGSEVTETDTAIQQMMVDRVRAAYPDHVLVGEEVGVIGGDASDACAAEYCWVTDPLDGTRNYAYGVPVFGTAIAVLRGGRPVVGLVRSLTTGDTYVATKGGGARHNGQPLAIGTGALTPRSMVAVQSTIRGNDSRIVDALAGAAALRNLGSTALHMALVAAGAFVGAVAYECKLWDVAAGWLLVDEAGGVCTDWVGDPLVPFAAGAYAGQDVPFVAAGREAHQAFLTLLAGVRDLPP
jgi:fructose-1,6-bisphosphatase/inositol monophosphatase family enzyme